MTYKTCLVAVALAIAAAACTHLREPDDTQLATLLRVANAAPADPDAQLDGRAIECLRAWSADKALLQGLPVRAAGEDGMKACRGSLDGLLADASRNPDKFTFQEVSAPKVVRRAMELADARRAAALANAPRQQGGPSFGKPIAPPAPPAPDPTVDLGAAGARLAEAEALCRQVQQASEKPENKQTLGRLAGFCAPRLSALRSRMEQAARSGQGAARIEQMVSSADNIANVAREALANSAH